MDKHEWQVLKSRHDLVHRTARNKKKAGYIQNKRDTPERLKGMAPARSPAPKVKVEVADQPKTVKKSGVFKRLVNRLTRPSKNG